MSTKSIRMSRALALVGMSAALAVAGATAAHAEEPASDHDPVGAHCWQEQLTGLEACADSEQQLADTVLLEYGIRILGPVSEPEAGEAYLPSSSALAEAAARGSGARGASPAATYVIGAFYADEGYNGASKVVTTQVTSNPCAQAGSYTYGYGNLVGAWNDAVSSFQGFGHCGFRLFWDADYSGSIYGPYFARSSVGVFNDQASSYEAQKVD